MTFLKAHGRFLLSACLAVALGGLLVSDTLWQHVLGPAPLPLRTSWPCLCPDHLRVMMHAQHPGTLFCEDDAARVFFYWHIGAATCVPLETPTDINDLRDGLFRRAATLPSDTTAEQLSLDSSLVTHGSPLQPGDCLRVTASRNLEKVDVCQKEEK
jgi:hypothetical protein